MGVMMEMEMRRRKLLQMENADEYGGSGMDDEQSVHQISETAALT